MKKHFLVLLAAALGLAACTEKKTDFQVTVNLKNGNDQMVYLQKYVDNAPVVIDSAIIQEETAVLKAPVDDIQILYALKVKDIRGSMPFFADNKDVSFVGDMQNPRDVEIYASETQTALDAYRKEFNGFYEKMEELYAQMDEAYAKQDSIMMDSLNKVGDAIMDEQGNFRNNYIKEHADSFLAHYILNEVKQDYSLDELKELKSNFITTSVYLDDLNNYIAKQETLEVGQPCIDFTLQTIDGQNVTLSEKVAQNKVTMIDFWASWCGPCRHENPVVKAAYEKYHEMGFDVIGISVDQDEAAWLKAVEADALPYTQVRDTDNSVSESYLIYYIPSNFLIDQNGNFIAKGLRGEELEAKLAEIFAL